MYDIASMLAQYCLGLVFLVSTLGKLRAPGEFAEGVAKFGVAKGIASFCAAVVIVAEALASVGYLVTWKVQLVAPLSVAFLLCLLAVTALALSRNLKVRCLCFGSKGDEQISARTLCRIAIMLCAAIFVSVRRGGSSRSPDLNVNLEGEQLSALGCSALLLTILSWCFNAPALRLIVARLSERAAPKVRRWLNDKNASKVRQS